MFPVGQHTNLKTHLANALVARALDFGLLVLLGLLICNVQSCLGGPFKKGMEELMVKKRRKEIVMKNSKHLQKEERHFRFIFLKSKKKKSPYLDLFGLGHDAGQTSEL